ncbi:hypothetical protein BGZ80_003894 [Entomortierella chlamydospora]|uniref:Uncharacterized protein n=1 Tax=Entomortierella chlamydospora TaxID=101097 RepID=A0A9P6N0F5_9FUNG|nr:hypothetical protein BGZ79_003965 [Entomortierella chlamydospora]KAG0020613.1 hypothetical protein BGZ80_003894 [Entomortierella chlamydospora]
MAGHIFNSSDPMYLFQPDPMDIGALALFLSCVSVMSFMIGRKTSVPISSLNYARGLVIALYITSWLFSFVVAILAQTSDNHPVSCTVSNFVCIFLYAASKVFIYLFMVERAHVVTDVGVSRWNSRMFKFNIALLAPFSVIVAFVVKFRVSEIDDAGYCRIGLQTQASVPFITYDILINVWLTFLFMRSLISSTSKIQGDTGRKLRAVARRTLVGAIVSLILTTSNIASVVAFNGHERSALCLALCTLDVTLNAVTIHWVTNPRKGSETSERSTPNKDWPSNVDSVMMGGQEVSPLRSHFSISIESHVEEYQQVHGLGRVHNH